MNGCLILLRILLPVDVLFDQSIVQPKVIAQRVFRNVVKNAGGSSLAASIARFRKEFGSVCSVHTLCTSQYEYISIFYFLKLFCE